MFDPCLGCLPLEQGLKYAVFAKIGIEASAIMYHYGSFFLFLANSVGAITAFGVGMGGGGLSTSWPVIVHLYIVDFCSCFGVSVLYYIIMLVFDVLLILCASERNP